MAMLLEKKLAETDLSKYVKSPREKFVVAVLQYRNWKTNYALDIIKPKWENMFTRITATFYFNEIIRYANSGISILSLDYKCLIDKNKSVEAIPVKNENQSRRILKTTKKNKSEIDVPVKRKPVEIVAKPKKTDIVEKFLYGIRFNGCCLITFENEREQEMFLRGLEMADIIKAYRKVHIKTDAITEVE